ncbi:S24 family peptidase [Desulfoluna sp.]|uniref:S24 family peptidase n=1 Tax=Desulfoluna sp. TaxID=2045199 RepID=UPI0026313ECA|nr:S24 family peptidase [Desulfoluna sp.]
MKWNREVFLHNLEELVTRECGGQLGELDRTVGMTGAFESWRDGISPTIDAIFKICQTFDCDITWLLNGYKGEQGSVMVNALVYIPKYRATLSGGGGSFETTAEVLETCPFGELWLRKKGTPSALVLFDVVGDSMAPMICGGDTVMVDRSRTGEDGGFKGGVFAFREGDTIKIKRLFTEGACVRVLSDNKAEAVDYQADLTHFEVIGEVVWVARDII